MNRLIKELWTSSPADVFDRVRRRANKLKTGNSWRWEHSLYFVLKNAKHMDPKGDLERWERYWRVLKINGGGTLREQFDFADKSVVELGCGPLLGFGPIALFCGAKRFCYHEPGLAREVLESSQIKARLFTPMYEELVANYGARMSFESWYKRVSEDAVPVNLDEDEGFDLCLSNSVLEHVRRSDLSRLLRQLRRLSTPDGWFFHAVDFGSHDSSSGLQKMYETADHREPHDEHINLLRVSEIEKELEQAGFEIVKSAAYKFDKIEKRNLHESWNSCSPRDLGTRVAIIIGKCVEIEMHRSPRAVDSSPVRENVA